MHLQHEARAPPLLPQPVVDPDHRHLDHVGSRALHHRVDREPLAERARLPVADADLRDRPAPAEQRRHVAVALGLLDRALDEVLHVREAGEIGVDVLLRLLARDLEVLGEPERRDAVDDPEVDHLGDVALVLRQLRRLLAEHLRRRRRVDVLVARERLAQARLAGDVREDPQLDLAVVGRDQPGALLGDEGGADLAAELRPDRDRLQVRIRRREAAGRGRRLVEGRVQASVVLGEQLRQRTEIGVDQLRELAPLLEHADDLVLAANRAEHARVGRVAGLALAAGCQAEHLEEDPRHLLRRAEHELLARELVRLRLQLLEPVGEPRRDLAHPVGVDLDAGVLHRREHRGERQLDLVVEPLGAALDDAFAHRPGEAPRGLGARDQRRRLLFRRRLGDHLEPVLALEVVDRVLGAAGLDQVGRDQRVVGRAHRQARQRLEVVRDEVGVAEPGRRAFVPGPDDDAVLLREREAAVRDREARAAAHLRQLALAPRNDGAGDRHRHGRRDRVLEVVDPVQQRAELVTAEHLAQLRAVGRLEHDLRRVEVEIEVASHRRQLLRRPRLVGELGDVLPPRRRELVRVRDHLLQRAVLRDQLAGGLVADPRDAGDVVGRVALEADEVGHLVGADPVAELDALGRVDVDVRDAARRHHQHDVRGAELEGIAVGRDDGRLHARLVGARRERRDHVVRLPALELEVAVAERLDDRPEVRELLAQEIRHRPPTLSL